jgi:hypothetical protein
MSYDIKKASTEAPLLFFMVESADHITALTGASPTVVISKNGGAFASPSGSVTEIADGWYKVAGNATDTGTAGPLALHATAASGDPSDVLFNVVGYDPQLADLGILEVQLTESYAATTVVPTTAQALQMILQTLLGFVQSGSTLTIYKRDNATTAIVGTFNSSSNATGVTQTT